MYLEYVVQQSDWKALCVCKPDSMCSIQKKKNNMTFSLPNWTSQQVQQQDDNSNMNEEKKDKSES